MWRRRNNGRSSTKNFKLFFLRWQNRNYDENDSSVLPLFAAVKRIIEYNASMIYSEYQKNNRIEIAPLVPKFDKDALSSYAYCLIVQQIIFETYDVIVPIAKELTQIVQYTEKEAKQYKGLDDLTHIYTSIDAEDMENYFFLSFDIASSNYLKFAKEKLKCGIGIHNHTDVFNKDTDKDFCSDNIRDINKDDIKTIAANRCRSGSSQLLLFFKTYLIAAMRRMNFTDEQIVATADIIYLGDGFYGSIYAQKYELEHFGSYFKEDYKIQTSIIENSFKMFPKFNKQYLFIDEDRKLKFNNDYILPKPFKEYLEAFVPIGAEFREIELTAAIEAKDIRNIKTQKELEDAIKQLSDGYEIVASNLMKDMNNNGIYEQKAYMLIVNRIRKAEF